MAKLHREQYKPDLFQWNDEFREYFDRVDRELAALSEASAAVNLDETVVGVVLRYPRGDGYAWYLVVGENPLAVQHIPFGDAWTVEPELIAGITRESVREHEIRSRAIAAIFSQKE